MNKKIILTGGTGLIGRKLGLQLSREGNEITLLTRNASPLQNKQGWATYIKEWDYNKPDQFRDLIDGKDAVIHLAGANLSSRRWNKQYKNIIYNSRIISTQNIVRAIESCQIKPQVFITVSAVGIYGNRGDELLTEESKIENDFLANLCNEWEREAEKIESSGVRRVSLRLGLVLSSEDGVLKKLLLPFKLFLGGSLGDGNQWFPWIHIQDVIDIIKFALKNESIEGAVNCAAPEIVRMKDFAKTLGKTIRRPSYIHIPRIALRIISGQIADSIISSQRISVEKLLKAGYEFKFSQLESALRNLLIKD